MAKNKRDCPALGQLISSARCGEERGSVIACPEECGYNPFGRQNYDQYSDLESKVIHKIMRRYVEEAGAPAMERLQRRIERHEKNPFLAYAESARIQLFEQDADGRTFVDRWQAARFAGLNRDEQRILRGMAGTRLSLIEVHRQIDDHTVEGVDLLDDEQRPVLVADRSLAGMWARFSTYLAWTYDAPHYRRMSGGAMQVVDVGEADPVEALTAIVVHLGGPSTLTEARGWMTEHIGRVNDSLVASALALMEAALDNIDVRFGKARYRWAAADGRAALAKRLSGAPDLDQGTLSDDDREHGWTECWDMLASPASELGRSELPPGSLPVEAPVETVLGSILLGDLGVLVQTSPGADYDSLKQRFEAVAQASVVFESEQVEDLASRLRQKHHAPYDQALVPPALLARPKKLGFATTRVPASETPGITHLRHHYANFADHPLQGLDHHTPRQAAADPALRPRLVRLMKRHLHGLDTRTQKDGEAPDIGWLLQDLGLEEINFPPPPARDLPDEEWDDGDEDVVLMIGDDEEDDLEAEDTSFESIFSPAEWDYDPSLVEVPASGRVLSLVDVAARVSDLVTETEEGVEPGKLITAIRAWPGFHEICSSVTGELNKDEFFFLVIHFYQAAAVLHPVPPAGACLNPGRVLHYFEEEQRRMTKMLEKHPKTLPDEAFVGDSPQPEVAQWLTDVVLDFTKGVKKSNRPPTPPMKLRLSSAIVILCFLRTGIRELCHWPVR